MANWTLVRHHPFSGSVTAPNDGDGVALGQYWNFVGPGKQFGWEQGLTLYRDGSGYVRSDQGDASPRYAFTNHASELFTGSRRMVVKTVYPATGDAQYFLVPAFKNPGTFGQELSEGWYNGINILWKDTTNGAQIYDGKTSKGNIAFTRAANANEVLTHDIEFIDNGSDSWTVNLTTTGSDGGSAVISGSVTFTAAGYSSGTAISFGIHDQGNSAFHYTNWILDDVTTYVITAETDGPALSSAVTDNLGSKITLTFTDESLPLLPASNITGFSVTQNGSPLSLSSVTRVASDQIDIIPASTISDGTTLKLFYTPGNLTDTAGNPFASIGGAGTTITNNSIVGTSLVDYPEQIITTRNFARVTSDAGNAGKEARTRFKMEAPYGIEPGWKPYYMGYSEGAASTLLLLGAAVVVVPPSGASFSHAFTFSGASSASIAPSGWAVADDNTPAVPLRSKLYFYQLYRAASTGAALPNNAWGAIVESSNGAADYDAAEVGDYGTLTRNVTGAIAVDYSNPLYAGAGFVSRVYQPAFVIGKPAKNYSSLRPRHAVMTVGNSIDVFQNDFGNGDTGDQVWDEWGGRGHQGRAFQDNIPYVVFGQGGSVYTGFTNTGQNAGAAHSDLGYLLLGGGPDNLTRKVTHGWHGYGENEILSPGTIDAGTGQGANNLANFMWGKVETDISKVWAARGVKYFLSTVTPIGSGPLSANGWTSGQTGTVVSQRHTHNQKVRTDYATLTGSCLGAVDLTQYVEDSWESGSNIWSNGDVYSTDKLHPFSQGMKVMAAAWAPAITLMNSNLNNIPGGGGAAQTLRAILSSDLLVALVESVRLRSLISRILSSVLTSAPARNTGTELITEQEVASASSRGRAKLARILALRRGR